MPSAAEALLARHQQAFAAYEDFLRTDTQTPPPQDEAETPVEGPAKPIAPLPQRVMPDRVARQQDPDETVLDMPDDFDDDAVAVHDDPSERSAGTPAPRDRVAQASPAARAPVSALSATSAMSAAAIARAIAAHGGLHHGPTPYTGTQSLHHAHTTASTAASSPSAAAAARWRNSAGPLAEVEQLIDARLRAAGRYRSTSTPDAMYVKSQAWALRRNQVTDALRREQADTEMEACTFWPELGPMAHDPAITGDGDSVSSPGGPHERTLDAVSGTVAEDPGVSQHLARLEEARRRRREAEDRLSGAASAHRWTGRPTVPHEFQLGLRVAEPIPSLRKPCSGPGADIDAAARPAPASASTSPSPPRPNGGDRAVAGRGASGAAVTPLTSGKRRAAAGAKAGGSPANAKSARASAARGTRTGTEAGAAPSTALVQVAADAGNDANGTQPPARGVGTDAEGQDLVRRLTDQLAHKDAVILAQAEDLERLHRELEAVKETLHQIASLGTAR